MTMEKLSFKFCPVCGKELQCGGLCLPVSRKPGILNGFTDLILFYSDENIKQKEEHPLKGNLFGECDKTTYFSAFEQPCIPAGYCEDCDRIFADIEIRERYNPIGEKSLPTYDMDYYCEETEESIKDENIYVQEDDPYKEWEGLIEWDSPDEKK